MNPEEAARVLVEYKHEDERIAAEIERLTNARRENHTRALEACAVLGVTLAPGKETITARKKQLLDRATTVLETESERVFSAQEISKILDAPVPRVRTIVDLLIARGRAIRVSRGRYRAVPGSKTEQGS